MGLTAGTNDFRGVASCHSEGALVARPKSLVWATHGSLRPCNGAQNEFPRDILRWLAKGFLRRAIPRSEFCYYTKRFLFDKVISLTFKLAALFIFAMRLFYLQQGFEPYSKYENLPHPPLPSNSFYR